MAVWPSGQNFSRKSTSRVFWGRAVDGRRSHHPQADYSRSLPIEVIDRAEALYFHTSAAYIMRLSQPRGLFSMLAGILYHPRARRLDA